VIKGHHSKAAANHRWRLPLPAGDTMPMRHRWLSEAPKGEILVIRIGLA